MAEDNEEKRDGCASDMKQTLHSPAEKNTEEGDTNSALKNAEVGNDDKKIYEKETDEENSKPTAKPADTGKGGKDVDCEATNGKDSKASAKSDATDAKAEIGNKDEVSKENRKTEGMKAERGEEDNQTQKEKDDKAQKDEDGDVRKDTDRNAEKDTDREAEKDTDREAEKDTDREAEKDTDREAEKDTAREAEKDTDREAEKDTAREAEKDTDREAEKDTDREAEKDTDRKAEKDKGDKAQNDDLESAVEADGDDERKEKKERNSGSKTIKTPLVEERTMEENEYGKSSVGGNKRALKTETSKKDSSVLSTAATPKSADKDGESDKMSEERTPTHSTPSSVASSGKRTRKSIEVWEPESFDNTRKKTRMDHLEVDVEPGRGMKLGDIPGMEESMIRVGGKKVTVLNLAHKLVFGGKGKMQVITGPKKTAILRQNLLRFSGFLPSIPHDEDEEMSDDREKRDASKEDVMTRRALKLNKSQLVELCNFFNIDRSVEKGGTALDKNGVANRLLDFLSEPSETFTKTSNSKKKKLATKPAAKSPRAGGKRKVGKDRQHNKKSQKIVEAEVVSSDDDTATEDDDTDAKVETDDEDEQFMEEKSKGKGKKTIPSDTDLKKWVKAYVMCFNLNKATTNHAIETATEKFGVDLSSKKAVIKKLLTSEIYDHMQTD